MTQHITLITTGGTIGSTINGDSVNVSQGEARLKEQVEGLCADLDISLQIEAPLNKNSEDLSPMDWLTIIRSIDQTIENGAQRIVITHGTDTMAYTATAIALSFANRPVSIVLTGSFYSLDHPKSDVTLNLTVALATVCAEGLPQGVYVSFGNENGGIDVIDALSIKPMAFDGLQFESTYGKKSGVLIDGVFQALNGKGTLDQLTLPTEAPTAKINKTTIEQAASSVFQLTCYPGINLQQLSQGIPPHSTVILNLYHSGTGPTVPGQGICEAITAREDLNFLLASFPGAYIDLPYESSVKLREAGGILIKDLQPHQLYVLFILGQASGLTQAEIIQQLANWQV